MSEEAVILKTKNLLKEKFGKESSGHDYWHMYRVWQLAKHIATREGLTDTFAIELAALLHDIADWKFHDGDKDAGPRVAGEWLAKQGLDGSLIKRVQHIMSAVPFRGNTLEKTYDIPIESKILHDADNLDSIGAIGVGRAFAYVGSKGRPMHDPDRPVRKFESFDEYRAGDAPPAINHFYERLLLLKDRMFTNTGKEIAQHRHQVMEQFLKEFLEEWEGKR